MEMIEKYIELVASMATAIGIVLAVIQLHLNQKQAQSSRDLAQSSRDLEISLNMVETFRERWEKSWRVALRKIEAEFSKNGKIDDDNLDDLLNMLNWTHWLGNLIAKKQLKNKQLIFDGIGKPLKDMLRVGQGKITDDIREFGIGYWSGLITVGNLFDIDWVKSLESQMPSKKASEADGV